MFDEFLEVGKRLISKTFFYTPYTKEIFRNDRPIDKEQRLIKLNKFVEIKIIKIAFKGLGVKKQTFFTQYQLIKYLTLRQQPFL